MGTMELIEKKKSSGEELISLIQQLEDLNQRSESIDPEFYTQEKTRLWFLIDREIYRLEDIAKRAITLIETLEANEFKNVQMHPLGSLKYALKDARFF